jgi:predicted RNA-binding protein
MCEATAFFIVDGQEEIILESVDLFEAENDQIRLINIFGEEKVVKGYIKALSLVDHKIVIEPVDTP